MSRIKKIINEIGSGQKRILNPQERFVQLVWEKHHCVK